MTAIKQVAVTSSGHMANAARYLDDERALMRGSQHIADERGWAREMAATREAYGHDKPSRAGAKATLAYHQVLAFLPEECSCNGGKMTPEMCMGFAQDWVRTRYPNQEAVWVLHKEHCKADGTDRFAVHVLVNRTDLETGRRLHEGRAKAAKVARAKAMRELDAKWGLRQMMAGERNSKVHAMQPTRAEREMARRGVESDKRYIRRCVKRRIAEISREQPGGNRMRELAHRLEADGVKMTLSKSGRQLQFQRGDGFKVNGNRLGRGYSVGGIAKGLGVKLGLELVREIGNEMGR